MLEIWKKYHADPDWNFSQKLSHHIKYILSLRSEPSNFVHFARLFQSELLNMCKGDENPLLGFDDPLEGKI